MTKQILLSSPTIFYLLLKKKIFLLNNLAYRYTIKSFIVIVIIKYVP